MDQVAGRIIRLHDDVRTADIIDPAYSGGSSSTPARHPLRGADTSAREQLQRGSILVAGSSFGHGPEAARVVDALKAYGVAAVIAASFDRAFFRAAINHGLPVVEVEFDEQVPDGEEIALDLAQGTITFSSGSLAFPPYPEFVRRFFSSGGCLEAVRKELGKR